MLCKAAAGPRTRSLAPCLASCARSFGFFVRSGASALQVPCYLPTPAVSVFTAHAEPALPVAGSQGRDTHAGATGAELNNPGIVIHCHDLPVSGLGNFTRTGRVLVDGAPDVLGVAGVAAERVTQRVAHVREAGQVAGALVDRLARAGAGRRVGQQVLDAVRACGSAAGAALGPPIWCRGCYALLRSHC